MRYLVYLFIIIFSIIYLIENQTYTKRIEIVNGYVKDFSVNRGEDVIAYLQPKEEHNQGIVIINNSKGVVVDSVILELHFQKTTTDTLLYQNGLRYVANINYNTSKLSSGLYFFDNRIPFVVKQKELNSTITVVFPIASIQSSNNEGGKSFYGYNSSNQQTATTLSLHRLVSIDDYYRYFLHWIDSIYGPTKVNVITDLDLENNASLINTKLLLIYGNAAFWTQKARANFDNYQRNSGNVLAIATSFMNNKYRYNKKESTISFYVNSRKDPEKNIEMKTGQWNDTIFHYPNYSSVGCSYEINYLTTKLKKSHGGFIVTVPQHSIFDGVNTTFLSIRKESNNSVKILNPTFSKFPLADKTSGNFYSKEILAYDYGQYSRGQTIGGIYLFQKSKTSGKLIVIGSESWLYLENFSNKNHQRVVKNCIDLLVK